MSSLTGDQLVPRGDRVELVTRLEGVSRSAATLTIVDSEGVRQDFRLRPDEQTADRFAHKMRINESLRYRVRSGDGQTEWHQLQVIDFPEVAEVQFSIAFPEYTNRPNVHRDRIPRRVKVIQGSVLELAIKPVEPLERLSLSLKRPQASGRLNDSETRDAGEKVQDLIADKEGWYRFRTPLLEDLLLRPTLLSPHGLKNQRRLFSRIEVIADKAPVARVVSPTDEMAVAIDDEIDVEFEAHDDHGIATAELVIYDESQRDADGKPMVVEVKQIPLGDQRMQKHVMGKTRLDLKELDLSEGGEISYAIRVTDNRNVSAEELAEPSSAVAKQGDQNHQPPTESDSSGQDGKGERLAKDETGEKPPSSPSDAALKTPATVEERSPADTA
ncbi:MAG: hypothetical protein MI861_08950, partial [Pirellulales bacterium]|nr:hypothetical protein [Pirellulales bacterium]